MSSPTTAPPKLAQSRPRRVQILLRDGGMIDGGVYLSDGQSLAPYLGTRKGGWVNVVSAKWRDEGETHNHAVVQADHILLATPASGDLPVSPASPGASTRSVDISLEDGSRIQGELHLAEKQRMSDYLSGCGKFMPVIGASRRRSDGPPERIGDVALNCGCVKAVRDAKVFASGPAVSPEAAAAAWGGLRRASTSMEIPVNREVVEIPGAQFEVITPGRIPDRRVGMPAYVSPVPRPAEAEQIDESTFNAEQRARAARASRHWLVRTAATAHLLPPDARALSDALTLEELWRGISKRNDIADVELAMHVAAASKLEFASLNDVTSEAIRIVPEKIARKLGILPVEVQDKTLVVAVSDPGSHEIEQQLGFVTRLNLRFVIASPTDIREALAAFYKNLG